MHSSNGLALVVLALFHSVYDVAGINCYQCDGDPLCIDPFNKGANSGRTVLSSDGWCWKVKAEGSGVQLTVRGGGPITALGVGLSCTRNECSSATSTGASANMCCCNADLCNGAQRINLTVSILLTILLLIIRY